MIQRIRRYVDALFADVPPTRQAAELKEEICSNLIDKFVDLTGRGVPEEEAYKAAVAGIGDIDAMIRALDPAAEPLPAAPTSQKSALFVAGAVMLYIVSFVPPILLDDGVWENLGAVLMFLMWGVATALLIYNHMTRPRYRRQSETVAEEFREWQDGRRQNNQLFGALSGALWLVVTALYFLISFRFGNWAVSWIVFLIGAALQQVLRAVFSLLGHHR